METILNIRFKGAAMAPVISSTYLDTAFSAEARRGMLRQFRKMVREVEFDSIVVTGASGLLIGGLLAHLTKKGIIIVRKRNEGAHSSNRVEGWIHSSKLVFVDDFIDTGATFKRVDKELTDKAEEREWKWKWVGTFLWRCDNAHCKTTLIPGTPTYKYWCRLAYSDDDNYSIGKVRSPDWSEVLT
jgi:hypothetical protein